MTDITNRNQSIISVSDLNKLAKDILENEFSSVWVQGEVSNFFSASSGHWYFSLKDQNSEIRCAMFAGKNSRISFEPKDGDNLILNGTLSIFEGRGQYQMIIDHIELAGEGALLRAFEDLKEKLSKEGLFDYSFKKQLPPFPTNIGVITSPDGAVLRDIINVLSRRAPLMKLTLIPALVQGDKSIQQLIEALEIAKTQNDLDVIILARGGGSIEDLWSFNNEELARSIYSSSIPIVSAIGHETDFTISDFVSDVRAPTPSAAAEMISQNHSLIEENLTDIESNLESLFLRNIEFKKEESKNLRKRLRHPGDKLRETSQKLDYLSEDLNQKLIKNITLTQKDFQSLLITLKNLSPKKQLQNLSQEVINLFKNLIDSSSNQITSKNHQLAKATATLDAVSPLAVLSRGYSILTTKDSDVISSADELKLDQEIFATLAKGKIKTKIIDIDNEN